MTTASKSIFSTFLLLLATTLLQAQVGIGTSNPASSAKLEIRSTTQGFLPPRMTLTERNAITSPVAGLMVYQTDGTAGLYYYSGSSWIYIVPSTGGSLSGFSASLNNQTGTTYTLSSSDNGKVVTLNNSSAITLTINTGLGDGFNCLIVQKGAGQVTITGGSGVTLINRQSQTKTAARHAVVTIVNIGSESGSEQVIVAGDTGT